jgi:PAS domain S-box-containing protein
MKRIVTLLFALMAAALGCAALADVYVHGRFTLIDPRLLGLLAVVGTGFLLVGLLNIRQISERSIALAGRADRLTALTNELESFIAQLEAANARLNASEARYKGLVDAQGDAILRRTPDGRLTYANEAFCQLFGFDPKSIIGQVFRPESHPESQPPVLGRLTGRETGRERVRYDQHVKTVVGYRWIAWEDYAIRDSSGLLVEIQSVGRDVTERKELETALTEARDKAQAANRAKSRFLATMSHEIRTPMNGVLGMSRLLAETQLSPDQRNYAEAIEQSGQALLALIEDILDFSKIESGAMELEIGDVMLRPLIESVAELLAPRAHAKGIDLATTVATDVPDIFLGDAARLRQVITNLVGNAVKFTSAGGVLVSAYLERRENNEALLCISVRDTGIGVPAEKRAQIFEEFAQADSSHGRRFEGTGLGLAISKRLIEIMDGKIGIVPAAGRGSVFWITLPLPAQAIDAERTRPVAGAVIGILSSSPILREGLKKQLAAAGARPIEISNLESFRDGRPSCGAILIDAGIGEKSAIPDMSPWPVPAVILIAPQNRDLLRDMGAKGGAAYLMKPVRQGSLEKRLHAVLSGETVPETVLEPQAAQKAPTAPLHILLAEDNAVNALLARELLRRRGHHVEAVTTGDAAVAACTSRHFDLVLMDLHMPGLDGIAATQRIRAAEKAIAMRHTVIVALTADALEEGRRACLEAGMDGFLTKPIDPDELDAILAATHTKAARSAA